MDKRIFALGLVVIIVGMFLVMAFWPLTGISGEDLSEKRDGQNYEGYEEGDETKVYGTVTEVGGADLPSWAENLGFEDMVVVEIDGNFTFTVTGTSTIPYSEGDSVYVNIALQEGTFGTQYWQADSKKDIKSKTTMDYIFYGVIGAGIAITAVGAVKD